MSRCPDWRRLNPADRDARHPGRPRHPEHPETTAPHAAARWREALRHFDAGCPHCRQQALAVDPTLIFRRLPAAELDPAREAEEVAAARLAVAAMRTASRAGLRSLPALRTLQRAHAVRWVLAASLTALALVFGAGHGWHGSNGSAGSAGPAGSGAFAGSESGAPTGAAAAGADASLGGSLALSSAGAAGSVASAGPGGARVLMPGQALPAGIPGSAGILPASSRPSIEGLSRPEARVYQLDSPHMSVVMIVDAKLDV
ncbi:MAG: hypothetical protein JOZ15_01195 [Acidobacteria bacterium]|nr:hypothetical protein [Acidobacteriota bacterium]